MAALFVLVRKATAEKVLEGLKGEGGTVMKASLDHARKAALQAVAEVKAAAPAWSTSRAARARETCCDRRRKCPTANHLNFLSSPF
jgi:hypothetical protein